MTRILGIDPGSRITGYGIIDIEGNHATHITHGIIRLKETEVAEKLKILFRQLSTIINEQNPDEVSIEKVFLHKNVDSALKLGQARGSPSPHAQNWNYRSLNTPLIKSNRQS